MKNIVYLMISSFIILIIVSMVVNLYKTNIKVSTQITRGTNNMSEVTSDDMLEAKEYIGSDVVSHLEYYRDLKEVSICVDMKNGKVFNISGSNRESKIDQAVSYINGRDENGNVLDTSFLDDDFEREKTDDKNIKFIRK